jgi:hypothetical protein
MLRKFIQSNPKVLIAAAAVGALLSLSSTSKAVLSFVELAPLATLQNGATGSNYDSSVIDGTTVYTALGAGSSASPQIAKLSNLNGTPSSSTLTSTANWTNNGNGGLATSISGLLWNYNPGSFLEIADSTTNSTQVIRIDKNSGIATSYVSRATIQAAPGVGGSGVSPALQQSSLLSNGELAFYETHATSIFATNGTNTLKTLLAATAFSTGLNHPTTTAVNGFTVDGNDIILGHNTDQEIYDYNTVSGAWTKLVSGSAIVGLTGYQGTPGVQLTNTTMFFAPDNDVYFYDFKSYTVLKFDPANAGTTLSVVATKSQLQAVENVGSSNPTVSGLTWYDNNIAWYSVAPNSAGLYAAVPEPTSLAGLAVAGSALLLRRRRVAAV